MRLEAVEALVDAACERGREVTAAIRGAVKRGRPGPAMPELPWVIAEIGAPDTVRTIRGFLDHKDAEIVASAVEALISLGAPEAIAALESLKNDPRQVQVEDESGAEMTLTIGELVSSHLRQ